MLVDCGTVRGHAVGAPGAVRVSHQLRPDRAGGITLAERLYLARRLAMCYWLSSAVVTTRLHAYLPALAMGRPAVLLGRPDVRTADYVADGWEPARMAETFRLGFVTRFIAADY